jgi:hypothetical protein
MMLKKQSKSNQLTPAQKQFTESFETLGDILSFQIKRKKNKVVLSTLTRMREIIEKLLLLRLKDAKKYETLMMSKEYLKHYHENKENAQNALLFMPENILITFTAATNQLRRIHECAVESGNDEASKETAYNINWLLCKMCKYPGYDLIIEQLLRTFLSMTKIAVIKNDPSAFTSSTKWYFDTLFEDPDASGEEFHLPYIEILNKYIFYAIRNIVLDANDNLFHALVYDLLNGSYQLGGVDAKSPEHYLYAIMDHNYETFRQINQSMQIGKRVNDLKLSLQNTTKIEKLQAWIQDFEKIDNEVKNKVPQEFSEVLTKLTKQICKSVVFQFKLNCLDDIVFTIGAFCVYAKGYDYIKYMWEYKQPPDSDSYWLGKDIVPNSYSDILNMFFSKNVWEMHRHDWHERHGSEIYYKRYFMLVFMRTLLSLKPDNEERLHHLQNYQLPNIDVHRLSEISHTSNQLITIAKWFVKETDLLNLLTLEPATAASLVEEVLEPFFQSLPALAKLRISQIERSQPTSESVKQSFYENVIANFYRLAKVRSVLTHYSLITDNRNQVYQGEVKSFGLRELSPKSAFFENWYVQYIGWGQGFAERIARGENSALISKLKTHSNKKTFSQFDSILSGLVDPDNYIIFAINIYPTYDWRDWKVFVPKYEVEVKPNLPESFCGQCGSDTTFIPVYQIFTEEKEKFLLLLNTKSIGHLIQLSPLAPSENNSLLKDIFRIEISVFSEQPKMIDEYIEMDALCIREYETIKEKREYLEERAVIAVHERFEYITNDKFEGYLFPFINNEE